MKEEDTKTGGHGDTETLSPCLLLLPSSLSWATIPVVQPLVECVPNFSEGRKTETVQKIADSIRSVASTCVLDTHIDTDHNRSVITFVAAPDMIVEAAVKAVAQAPDRLDRDGMGLLVRRAIWCARQESNLRPSD